ncbi:hypothetical protein T06_16262, partial [Trichinella sp. T6]
LLKSKHLISKRCEIQSWEKIENVEKSFLYTCTSIRKTPHGQNIAPGTKTTVNNGIAIKRSQGERHAVRLPQLRWSDVEKASK